MSNILDRDFIIEVAKGNVTGHEIMTISATATGRSINTETTFWELQGDYTYLSTAQTLYISSTSVSDTTQQIIVEGLDSSYNPIVGIATLNGQNQVALVNIAGGGAITFLRVNGAVNPLGTDNLDGDVYVSETDTLTGGVPDTFSKIKEFIQIGDNVQRSSVFTVKAGYTMFLFNSGVSTRKNDELKVDFVFRTEGGISIRPTTLNVYQIFAATPLGYIPINEKTDFELKLTPINNNSAISWVGDFLVINNDLLPNL